MLAHHPETGQPIRILTSDAQVSQSHRTLVWLQPSYLAGIRWNRWTTVVSDPAASFVGLPNHAIVQKATSEWVSFLKNSSCMVWVSQEASDSLAEQGIDVSPFLILEDLFSMYPFLGEPVHASDPVEKIVISIAHILRFHIVVGTFRSEDFGVKAQEKAWSATCQGIIRHIEEDATDQVVPECWLVQQYYVPEQSKRSREINTCLEKNIENSLIDHILLLNETGTEVPTRFQVHKVHIESIEGRMTYAHALKAIQSHCPPTAIAMFSNSDIWFDESLAVLWSIPLAERRLFLALLRWEEKDGESTLFGPRNDSQDSWIVARSSLDFEITEEEFGFPFGKPGCDNAISVAMLRKKCLVINPAYSIKTHHVHASNIRTYDPRDILYKPMYLYVDPTPIQLMTVEHHLRSWKKDVRAWKASRPIYSFFHGMKGMEDDLQIICTALKQKENLALDLNVVQSWAPPPDPEPLYEWSQAFVSPHGLVSTFRSIFVGDSEVWRAGWSVADTSSLTPTVHVPELSMVHSKPEDWSSTASWAIRILPTILRIREAMGPMEFLVPAEAVVGDFLRDCLWKENHVGAVPYMENVQYYADRLVIPEPVQDRKITTEDIERLQELLPSTEKEEGVDVVVCLDDLWTAGWWEELATCQSILLRNIRITCIHPEDSHAVRRVAFQKADWIIGSRSALRWAWMSRAGTKWLEWMLETDISSEIYWLAAAAHCTYIPSLVRKEPVEFQRQRAIVQFGHLWKKFSFVEAMNSVVSEKPVVYLPAGKALEGMGAHAADTFREMVEVWGEKGLCSIQQTEETPYVWWGAVGDTVLYDWDTARWWNPTTPYRLALFGNCPPPGPQGHEMRQSLWSFWPRSPRRLETVVHSGILSWADRTISSIFLGKVENGVQHKKRCGADWSSAVELFSMPIDSTGGYKYSQEEYLEKLRHSKFGLCLAGYGNKCNREIEYMALGVVPICTPEVDMKHYLVPPREGVHYFRASTPEQVRSIVASCTPEKWKRMSAACCAWWRDNASAEGLFRLTWARIEQCKPFAGLAMPPFRV